MLTQMTPSKAAIEVFEAFVKEAVLRKRRNAQRDRTFLERELTGLREQHNQLLRRIVSESDPEIIAALKELFKDLQENLRLKELQREKLGQAPEISQEMFEHSREVLSSPSKIWRNGGMQTKQAVLRTCFAEPPRYSLKRGFRTPEPTLIFKALSTSEGGNEDLVEPSGIEPLTSCMPCRRSPS